MTGRTGLVMAAMLLAGPVPARAGGRPPLRPTRDVAVQYRVTDGGTIRMWWTGGGQVLRIELEGAPSYAVVNYARQRMMLVVPQRKLTLDAPFDPRMTPGFVLPPDTAMTRAGTDTVAGIPCTVWELKGAHGTGAACVTGDGLLLRAKGEAPNQGAASMEAKSVAYGPQPAWLFAPPDGFRRMDLTGRPQ